MQSACQVLSNSANPGTAGRRSDKRESRVGDEPTGGRVYCCRRIGLFVCLYVVLRHISTSQAISALRLKTTEVEH